MASCQRTSNDIESIKDNISMSKESEESMSTEIKKVQEAVANWVKAFNDKDVEALMALYDSDINYASPSGPLLKGIEQVRPRYESSFDLIKGTLRYIEEEVTVEGGMAVVLLKFYFQPPAGVKIEDPSTGRAMLVFRKSKSGEWLLLFDMDNSPSDVTVADFANYDY